MQKYISIFLVLWSLNNAAMEVNQQESAIEEICHFDLIPDEILVMILEAGALNCFRDFKHRPRPSTIADDEDYDKSVRGVLVKILAFLKNHKLVCKRFNRCSSDLIQNSSFAHFPNGRTPLMLALRKRDYHLAKYLLVHGADPNLCDNKRKSPLMVAIKHCTKFKHLLQTDILDLMLESGADVNAKDSYGQSALGIILHKDFREIDKIGHCKSQYIASIDEIKELIKLLIGYGVNLNDSFGHKHFKEKRTALGWAINLKKENIAQVLAGYGAHIDYEDHKSELLKDARKKRSLKTWLCNLDLSFSILTNEEQENIELGGARFCAIS